VTIVGAVNLPATMAVDASRMYAKNVEEVVKHLTPKTPPPEGAAGRALNLDLADEITGAALALHAGEARHPAAQAALGGAA
jgi:NAD(P) transhydrogenase subunit alpha